MIDGYKSYCYDRTSRRAKYSHAIYTISVQPTVLSQHAIYTISVQPAVLSQHAIYTISVQNLQCSLSMQSMADYKQTIYMDAV
jgi:hypothetical protein